MTTMATESPQGDTRDFELEREGVRYVVHQDGPQLRLAIRSGERLAWLDTTVPVGVLGGEARRALETGDHTCPALLIGLKGVVAIATAVPRGPERRIRQHGRQASL